MVISGFDVELGGNTSGADGRVGACLAVDKIASYGVADACKNGMSPSDITCVTGHPQGRWGARQASEHRYTTELTILGQSNKIIDITKRTNCGNLALNTVQYSS